jgi:hypothetical protein
MMEENLVQEIMGQYAAGTGLLSAGAAPVRRYLWTDAFAVSNFLALYKYSSDEAYLHLALGLVDQVHDILGRHRDDDTRSGWISGLDGGEGRLHPTAGGLRIGKKLPEREPGVPYDEKLEWERDGQYYHYLTKWMHALCSISRAIDNPVYASWAAELAGRAHRAFYHIGADGEKRLYWKMSIDLSRPQVAAMGHHDSLDGLISCIEILEQTKGETEEVAQSLEAEINDLADMSRGVNWTTPDALGLGGLLADAWRLVQLQGAKGNLEPAGLLQDMLEAAAVGLSIYTRDNSMHQPADYRLAFRELGLCIGLQAIERIEAIGASRPDLFKSEHRLVPLLGTLKNYLPLRWMIKHFWLKPENWEVPSWKEHADINMVMLATSLMPEGYLDLNAEC